MQRRTISASVREVVNFVLRSGDLGGGAGFSGRDRALEGTRGHQRVQRQRPADYQAEVPVTWRHEEEGFEFALRGRIDGLRATLDCPLLEEIKTVHSLSGCSADPLHVAQARIYGFIYAQLNGWKRMTLRLTYVELDSERTLEFDEAFAFEDLQMFFERVLGEYLVWVRAHVKWCNHRDRAIKNSSFPFPQYREGQRTLAVAVYRAIKQRGRLFAEAPTGIGKTISTLFPAVKALAEGHVEKIFYATAKTSGRQIAETAFGHLGESGANLRRVTLTARDKICFNGGKRCDVTICPYAIGYYDRIKPALQDALAGETFTRPTIESIAQKHQVCPFELSLDLSIWADAIICDYNYIFDPAVALDRYFDGEKHSYAILIDEAHNLIDRAREMFSAELSRPEIEGACAALEPEFPGCAKTLSKVARALSAAHREAGWERRDSSWVAKTAPTKLVKAIEKFLDEAEACLVQEAQSAAREQLLEPYFNALSFRNTAERFDEHFRAVYDSETAGLKLLCIDPAKLLQAALKKTGSAVFFSATLRPIDFFRRTLGGDLADATMQLTSPFPREKLGVLVCASVNTRFSSREASYGTVAECIAGLVLGRAGKYLIFFPAYTYLTEVMQRFKQLYPDMPVIAQSSAMRDVDREAFLRQFHDGDHDRPLAGFAVLGGIFGEGIDLVGDRLIGAVIVGVGLPQLCLERDLIKEHAQERGEPGFEYAYTFPGMNRVLQAVGRVVRSEQDRGIVLLIDDRFRQPLYQGLLPEWWRVKYANSVDAVKVEASNFWSDASAQPIVRSGTQ